MQIVFNRVVADQLRARYTVLDLEEFNVDGKVLEAFCVVPVEKLAFMDLTKLQEQKDNHQEFVLALSNKEWKTIIEMYATVCGSFGGELDTFYSEIVSRAKTMIAG